MKARNRLVRESIAAAGDVAKLRLYRGTTTVETLLAKSRFEARSVRNGGPGET